MNHAANLKLLMMRRSVRCLIYGLIGLLPAIGLPFALAACWLSGSVRKMEKQYWNPAKPYRIIGFTCAAVGTIGWFLVLGLIVAGAIANQGGM